MPLPGEVAGGREGLAAAAARDRAATEGDRAA